MRTRLGSWVVVAGLVLPCAHAGGLKTQDLKGKTADSVPAAAAAQAPMDLKNMPGLTAEQQAQLKKSMETIEKSRKEQDKALKEIDAELDRQGGH